MNNLKKKKQKFDAQSKNEFKSVMNMLEYYSNKEPDNYTFKNIPKKNKRVLVINFLIFF